MWGIYLSRLKGSLSEVMEVHQGSHSPGQQNNRIISPEIAKPYEANTPLSSYIPFTVTLALIKV